MTENEKTMAADSEKVYEFTKYNTDSKGLKATLEKYGVAVIPRVLNKEECESMMDGMWDFFEHITGDWTSPPALDRSDTDTWRSFYDLFPLHSMLVQHYSVGQAQASWDRRQNPKMIGPFAEFYGCEPEDLLVSFDGLSFGLPPEITNKGWHRKTWLHTDQNFDKKGFHCMQSWVTAKKVNEGDATLAFLEGSHIHHEEFGKTLKEKVKGDWYKLSDDERQFYTDQNCPLKKIACPAGSMVFWDSRTIHCGAEALKTRAKPNIRYVIYLCYAPRSQITPAMLKKKQNAFINLRTTNHWPCNPKLFPKTPRTYGKEIPELREIEPPELTELGMRLAGYD